MIKDKLRKIYELVQQGDPGERDNARILLDELLTKYNLTEQDLIEERTETRIFSYKDKWHQQFVLCIIESTLDREIKFSQLQRNKRIFCELTDLDYLQVNEVLKYYEKILKKEIRNFKKNIALTILSKYDLVPKYETKENNNNNNKKQRKSDNIDWNQVLGLLNTIKQPPHRKQLN